MSDTDQWLAGYEAAKAQAADALDSANAYSFNEAKCALRARCAKMIRGMVPKREAVRSDA